MEHFSKYLRDGEKFIVDIAYETNTPWDKIRAARIMRAVLHALRNRLSPASSLQFMAQLPMLIKAIYVDGWKIDPMQAKTMRHIGDFLEAVREEAGPGLADSLSTDHEVRQAVQAVFSIVRKYVSDGEIKDVLATLPTELRPLLAGVPHPDTLAKGESN